MHALAPPSCLQDNCELNYYAMLALLNAGDLRVCESHMASFMKGIGSEFLATLSPLVLLISMTSLHS